MHIQIQLRIVADDDSVISEGKILQFNNANDQLEVIGLLFDEAKAALATIQGILSAFGAACRETGRGIVWIGVQA